MGETTVAAEPIAIAIKKMEMVELSTLRPYPLNPNNGDLNAIEQALKTLGMADVLIVNEPTREILGGNHRFHTLLEAGNTVAPVAWVNLDEKGARKLNLALNKVGKLSWTNKAELLESLESLDLDLLGTGYTIDDQENLIADLDKVQEETWGEFKGAYAETPEQTAARGEGVANTVELRGLKETTLVHSVDDYNLFCDYVKVIRQYTKLETTSAAVLDACRVYAMNLESHD